MGLQDFLEKDEEIRWLGAPGRGIILRVADIVAIPFSLLWGGFALFLFLSVFTTLLAKADAVWSNALSLQYAPILLIGGLFSFIALYLIVGRFVVDILRRWRTSYAVTNRRALIYGGLFSQELQSQELTRGLHVRVSGRRRGSIKFGEGANWPAMKFQILGGPSHPFIFERIRDVRTVYELVRRVQSEA